MKLNQAVVFTKPTHHLSINLTPQQLAEKTRDYFLSQGFQIIFEKEVSGLELKKNEIIKQHYVIYSTASCAEKLTISDSGKEKFSSIFGKNWDQEVLSGHILSTQELLTKHGFDENQLFTYWNDLFVNGKAHKLESGFIIAWLDEFKTYLINAFYPSMELNFCHPDNTMYYFVMNFDPTEISWEAFRKQYLGSTNASTANPSSFRGRLYAEYSVDYPGRDNFVHGSAGPFEGLIERSVHEHSFGITQNPIGNYFVEQNISLADLRSWKEKQTLATLSQIFDDTEEKNSDEVIGLLEKVDFHK